MSDPCIVSDVKPAAPADLELASQNFLCMGANLIADLCLDLESRGSDARRPPRAHSAASNPITTPQLRSTAAPFTRIRRRSAHVSHDSPIRAFMRETSALEPGTQAFYTVAPDTFAQHFRHSIKSPASLRLFRCRCVCVCVRVCVFSSLLFSSLLFSSLSLSLSLSLCLTHTHIHTHRVSTQSLYITTQLKHQQKSPNSLHPPPNSNSPGSFFGPCGPCDLDRFIRCNEVQCEFYRVAQSRGINASLGCSVENINFLTWGRVVHGYLVGLFGAP